MPRCDLKAPCVIFIISVAYKFHMGPYGHAEWLFLESCSISPKLCSITDYYDNLYMVPLRTTVWWIAS
jgi:hypothetical protein